MKSIGFVSLVALLLTGYGLPVISEVLDKPVFSSPQPSDQNIERALQLGNQFQAMGYRQIKPRTGISLPFNYIYRPDYYNNPYSGWSYPPLRKGGYYPEYSPHSTPTYLQRPPFLVRPPLRDHNTNRHSP